MNRGPEPSIFFRFLVSTAVALSAVVSMVGGPPVLVVGLMALALWSLAAVT